MEYLARKVTSVAQDIREQLEEAFRVPLPQGAGRRIVFWHDVSGEFGDTFRELSGDGAAELGDVEVRCVSLEDRSAFGLKRDMTREHTRTNYLVYTRRAKDDLNGDWLADVELYSEHFQSDATSLVLQEIGASDAPAVRNVVRRFARFFRAKDRRAKFLRRIGEVPRSAQVITCGVLSVLLGAQDARPESVVLAYAQLLASSLDSGEKPNLGELRKYDAQDVLEELLQKACGYGGELENVDAFLSQLLLTAASPTLPAATLSGLDRFVSAPSANFCITVVRAWMHGIPNEQNALKQSDLYAAATQVEQSHGLADRFLRCAPAEIEGCDVFPCVDACLLQGFIASMAEGADRRDEVRGIFDVRKNLKWYPLMAVYYDCLLAACEMQDFQRSHGEGFHYGQPQDAWKAYTTDWWRMDAAYRHFRVAYHQSKLDLSEVDDAVDRLSGWADGLYANWYLSGVNACWVGAAKPSWAQQGEVAGIPRQRDFYRDQVWLDATAGKKVVVIVSDGMRYEVARELANRLGGQLRGTITTEAMHAVLPSETRFGMAALLPNKSIGLEDLQGDVLVDGRPSGTTEARQLVLDAALAGSRAIRYKDLQGMSRAERKEWGKDAPVVYVYHNAIDTSGHHELTGQDVFESCDQAINEVASMVNIALKDLGAQRVLVTADHGFLYTAGELAEADKVPASAVRGNVLYTTSRYLVCEEGATSDAYVPVNLSSMDGGRWAWLFAPGCIRVKAPGSKNYMHGGVSIQECCVPAVRVSTSGHTSSHKATIQLLGTNRRVTNSFFSLRFFQKEPVGGKVLPAEYELVMTDDAGIEVSDVRPAQANNPSHDENARRFKLQFALRPGFTFSGKKTYYLVVREKGSGRIAWREQFTIDVSFAPLEDFGF